LALENHLNDSEYHLIDDDFIPIFQKISITFMSLQTNNPKIAKMATLLIIVL